MDPASPLAVLPGSRAQQSFAAQLWNELAWLLVTRFQGRSGEARQHVLRALRLDRSRHEYFDTLAVALAQSGQVERAKRWIAVAIRRAPAAQRPGLERRRATFEAT